MSDIVPRDDIPLKQCNKCLNFYPATLAYFHMGRRYKMGLVPQCKKCKGKGTNFGKVVPPKEYRPDEKQCSTCKNWFPQSTDFFNRDKSRPDGFNLSCKECLLKDRQKRQDKIDQYQKAYRINNHEAVLERQRKRWDQNREKNNARTRERYREHREERLQYVQRYKATHRDRYNVLSRNRDARKREAPGTYNLEEVRQQYDRQKGKCYYCHTKVKWGEHSVDHTYPLSRASGDAPINSIDYLVITCRTCNNKKSNKYPWEWPEGGRLL